MKFLKGQRGFSLVELILSIIIIGIMAVAMGRILGIGIDSYSLVVDRREMLQRGRLAMNMMTNELQTIQDPATEIASISATQISFTNADSEAVTYQVSGGSLLRNGQTLASDVDASSGFAYYTLNNAVTADPTQVYRIGITLVIDLGSSQSGSITLESDVYLRNRYYDSFTQT